MRYAVLGLLVGVLLFSALGARAEEGEEALGLDTPVFWLERAEAQARQIVVPDGRAALLVSIGTGYVEAGEKGRALELLRAAVQYGTQCTGCFAKAKRLADIGLLLTKAGDPLTAGRAFDEAGKAAEELDDPVVRVGALCTVAERRAEAGDVMPAQIALARVEKLAGALEGSQKAEAFLALISAWSAVGEPVRARAAYEPIRRNARAGTKSKEEREFAADLRVQALLQLVVAAVESEDFVLARERANAIREVRTRISTHLLIAKAEHGAGLDTIDGGLLVEAFEQVSGLKVKLYEAYALLEVAGVAQEMGVETVLKQALDQAYAVIPTVELAFGPSARFDLLVAWADQARAAGLDARAIKALDAADRTLQFGGVDARTRESQRAMAAAWARAGRFEWAEKRIDALGDPMLAAQARLDVAEILRAAGKVEDAKRMGVAAAKGIAPPSEDSTPEDAVLRGELLRRFAVLMAACGAYKVALATVEIIDRPFQAATACTYIARDLTP